ncbi:MAG: hypothetical protein GY822_18325 [Deltaproteobacteria bacterium]|nr:hypothetical protein [Deltaproteobacteria bacterium]
MQSDGHVVELQSIGFFGEPVRQAKRRASKSGTARNQRRASKNIDQKGESQLARGAAYVRLSRGDRVTWVLVPKTPIEGDEMLLRVPSARKIQTLLLKKARKPHKAK